MTAANGSDNTAPALSGWDELGPSAPSWKIEREKSPAGMAIPFFSERTGAAHEKLLANLPVMMHAMDGSGRVYSVNKHWCSTLGYEPGEVIGRSFNEFLTVESRSRLVTEIYPQYLQSGSCRNEELFVRRKDGTLATVALSMNAHRNDKGRVERTICLLQDVTDRKVAEIASTRNDQRFRGAFAAAAHGVALVSPTGQIELANPALNHLLGSGDSEKLSIPFDEILHADDRGVFLNGMRQLLSGEIPLLKQDLRYVTGPGGIVHGATTVSMVKSENGHVEQLVVHVVDVTDRKLISQRLYQAQKMEAIGQLTGGLAHDFNNLLTVIIGSLQLSQTEDADDGKISTRINDAIETARKGSILTKQLLAFAREQQLEPQDANINEIVMGMEPLIARTLGENIELMVHTGAESPSVLVDRAQFEASILNLAINARDAMPDGGALTLETALAHLDHEYAEKHPEVMPGPHVMIAVSDNGAGMTPEVLEKAFHPFFTTKGSDQNSGLGLSMVYGLIKQSGGHINIYSELGHGTSIKMYLPAKNSAAAHSTEPGVAAAPAAEARPAYIATVVEPAPGTNRKRKVLVVEDQEAVRAVACSFLEDFGYDLIEAGDGFQALAKLQEDPEIDLMFSDIVMPGGMNGFDLAQAATGMRPNLKVIHTSGYPKGAVAHQDEPRFKQGFVIMKPYRREELRKIISQAFEERD